VIEEGFNRGNLAALDDLFTPDFREHQRGFPTPALADEADDEAQALSLLRVAPGGGRPGIRPTAPAPTSASGGE